MSLATCSSWSGNVSGTKWPAKWGTSGRYKIICDRAFVFNGQVYLPGRISDPIDQNWCALGTITIDGNNVPTFSSFTLPQTDTGITNVNNSGEPSFTLIIYSNDGRVRRTALFQNWRIGQSLTTSFNFAALASYNDAVTVVNPRPQFLDKDEVVNIATALINAPASTTQLGLVELSVPPVDATTPIAAGDNDSRVPTQNENDALAGTNGSPSSANKYVTNSDPRIATSGSTVFVASLATGGTGTSVSPFTGWEQSWASDKTYRFGGFYYQTATTLSLSGLSRINLYGEGATITFTGTGKIIRVVDPGSARPSQVCIRDFHLVGTSSATYGLAVESVSNSVFKDIWVSKVSTAALYTYFAISNLFDRVTLSINSDGTAATPHPQYGYLLDGSGGAPTEANTFRGILIEGATVRAIYGITIIANNFYVETIEANGGGIELDGGSIRTTIFGGNYEGNNYNFSTLTAAEGNDFILTSCDETSFVSVFSVGTLSIGAGATGTVIAGANRLGSIVNSSSAGQLVVSGAYSLSGSFTGSDNAVIVGTQTTNPYTIGGTRLTGSGGLLVRPASAGANVFEVSPNGASTGVVNLFDMDRTASPNDITGLTLHPNNGASTRIQTFSFGAGTQKALYFAANLAGDANYNSASANQLMLETNGDVKVGGGTGTKKIFHGTAVLTAGVVVVASAGVTASSRIFVNRLTDGGTVGASYSVTRSAGVSFTITSKDGTGSTQTLDTSTVTYYWIEP